ncbi:MAG: hypothetical protein WA619_00845 [Candidatus Acidiferrum sp.]
MPDEHVVLNGYTFTNESMRGNLTVTAYFGVLLNLDEGPDFRVIANLATIKIDEFGQSNPFSQFYVG